MKTFISYVKEDNSVETMPAGENGKAQDPLKNPSLMHNSYNDSVIAARKMSSNQTDINDRAYIISNKYYEKQGVKQFTVVYNKTLLSLAPDWEQRGYEIIGWVSQADGLVTRTKDGNYVKDTSQ
jgi:hypothetical protein